MSVWAVRRSARRSIERRVPVAAATTGLGVLSCGGRLEDDDLQGACSAVSRASAPSCDTTTCTGEPGRVCKDGMCASCGCSAGEYCDEAGKCQINDTEFRPFWFAGQSPSTHGCCGAPPVLV